MSNPMTGSQIVLDCLVQEGVETIFGYPGGAIMPIYDALYDYTKQLKHILTRHEQGAIHMAQGFARASGKTGVVFATSGPGATNLVTGLADAQIDSTPLVCITGQVFAHLLGSDAFQETDIINITSPITKWNYQITDAKEIQETIAKAFYIASSGRKGPVLIDITKNAQIQLIDKNPYTKVDFIRSYRPKPVVRHEIVKKAAALINASKKPFIIWGQGVILGNAEVAFRNFVEKSGIPAASTVLGLGALPTNHPQYVGMLGMHGNYAPNVLTNDCDTLIAIGMRFDDRVTGRLDKYAKQAKIIHLDIDPAEINKNVATTIAVWGDCNETLPLLTAEISEKKYPEWLAKFEELFQEEKKIVIDKEMKPESEHLTMAEVIFEINKATSGKAILVTDVGQHQMVTCRYGAFLNTRSNITSGGLGTMGFGLPAAIGAKFGAPNTTVIGIIGDGGFQMTLQELAVIMQEKLDVKIIILNNSFLGMVRQWQELFNDKRYSEVEILSPNYITLAAAYNIPAQKISKREDLKIGLERLFQSTKGFLLEVIVGKENNVFPMVPQGKSVSEIRLF